MENMSVEELREQISKIESQKSEIERRIKERLISEKSDFVSVLRDKIALSGYDIGEIIQALMPKKKNKAISGKKSGVVYVSIYDETLRYRGMGRLPEWMRHDMMERDYDPANPAHRREYIEDNMRQI